VAITASLVLFQVGELSFMVLHHLESAVASSSSIAHWFKLWLNPITHAIVLSMFITPLVVRFILKQGQAWLTSYFTTWDQSELLHAQSQPIRASKNPSNRVILVGYGPVAQQLAEALRIELIGYHVIESNPQTVKNLQAEGISATFGDATSCSVLEAVGIQSAEMLVVTVPIRSVSTDIIFNARQLNPDVRIVARAKYRSDVEPLYEAGSDAVIYDELESGHRLIHSSLIGLGFTLQESHSMGLLLRHQFESEFHESSPNVLPEVSSRLALVGDTLLEWFTVPEACPFLLQTLEKSKLRQKTGVNIVTIIKAQNLERMEATANSLLEAGDVLIALGKNEQLERFRTLLSPSSHKV
jgi:CPA2 family monovalent cation:H+ antiporter-2